MRSFSLFKRYARGIGNPSNAIESSNHCGGINHRVMSFSLSQCQPRLCDRSIVSRNGVLSEVHEYVGVEHRRYVLAVDDALNPMVYVLYATALTEQGCMASRSIETLLKRRDARREKLDLRVTDGPVLAGKIPHFARGHIHLLEEIPPVHHRDWN